MALEAWTCLYANFNNHGKKNLVEGMDFNGDHDLSFCDGFMYGKHHSYPISFKWGFSYKGNYWACAHKPM